MEIITSKGQKILIDEEDSHFAEKRWCVNNYGYAVRTERDLNGRQYTAILHRLVLGLGRFDGTMVDHINGNKLDNRRCNLRIATNSQNIANSKTRIDNTSGFRGVHLHRPSGKFHARIRLNNIEIYLGSFDKAEDAANVYAKASIDFYGDFRRS